MWLPSMAVNLNLNVMRGVESDMEPSVQTDC